MKNNKQYKFSIILFSVFLVGAAQISEETCEQGIKDIAKVITIDFYQLQLEQMMLAYNSKDPMTGISIIENSLEWILSFKNQGNMILDENSLPKEKAIWFVRLGNLRLKLGEQEKYELYLEMAVTVYNSSCSGSTCKKITKEKIVWLVNKMDNP